MTRLDLGQTAGARILLVKGAKVARFAQPLAVLPTEFIGPQQLTFGAFPGSPVAEVEHFIAGGFERQDNLLPLAIGERMPGEVGLIEAVGDNDDSSDARMIKPTADNIIEAFIDEGDADVVVGVFDFQRIVDDDVIGAVSGQLTANRRGVNPAARRGGKVRQAIANRRPAGSKTPP